MRAKFHENGEDVAAGQSQPEVTSRDGQARTHLRLRPRGESAWSQTGEGARAGSLEGAGPSHPPRLPGFPARVELVSPGAAALLYKAPTDLTSSEALRWRFHVELAVAAGSG